MKVVKLVAENIKKLVAVEITPDGNLVQITGKNGQGKTSVLDSIWWALAGAGNIQGAPIRKGATHGRIKLDLGELQVTRVFKQGADGHGPTTSIIVENAEGARFPSPQKMLDDLLDSLAFDPLRFARMDAKEQFNALRVFVPGVDFEAIANADRGDRERRTDLGRQAKQERAAAALIQVPADTPEQEVDEAGLVQQLETAGNKNAELEQRKARREAVHKEMVSEEQTTERLKARAEDLRRDAASTDKSAEEAAARAKALRAKLDEAPELPPPVNTTAISAAIALARATNANVRKRLTRAEHNKKADELENQVNETTAKIAERQKQKDAAIAAAKMPVEGLSLGDGVVLFDSLPLDQASDAEQLRISVAVAMAGNPKLRVIRVRDGSLLDEHAMLLLARMAEERDYQIWCERVDSSGKIGFVLEDGHVRKADPAAAEAKE